LCTVLPGGDITSDVLTALYNAKYLVTYIDDDKDHPYGEKTGGATVVTFAELKNFYEHQKHIIPLKLYPGKPWPPQTLQEKMTGTDEDKEADKRCGAAQALLNEVFAPGIAYHECVPWDAREVADMLMKMPPDFAPQPADQQSASSIAWHEQDNQTATKGTTLFIGNPGTGKSSTLNCYLKLVEGLVCFKSGISKDGGGLTYKLDVREHDGQKWMDTPGLSCLKHRKAAAAAINEALEQGGRFRMVFVMTLESGRVRPDDITTINLVIEACNAQVPQIGDDKYAILINKTSNNWLEQMDQASREDWKKNTFSTPFQEKGMPTTEIVHFAPFVEEMNDANNKVVPLCSQTRRFIDQLPVLKIDPAKVRPVNADDFDALCEKMNEMTDKLIEAQEEAKTSRQLAEEERQAKMLLEVRAFQAERQVEESKKEAASAKAQAKADVDAALRRHKEELERRTGKITATREGKGVGDIQLWNSRAEDIVMVNDTGVAVIFSGNDKQEVIAPAKSRVSRDWAYNAILFWETPDVTVSWVAATEPEQRGSMKLEAGQVLQLSQ